MTPLSVIERFEVEVGIEIVMKLSGMHAWMRIGSFYYAYHPMCDGIIVCLYPTSYLCCVDIVREDMKHIILACNYNSTHKFSVLEIS